MILTKQFLNEKKQQGILNESFSRHKPQELNEYDVFISYTWSDRQYAHLIEQLLKKCGYSAYVDFNDLALNRLNVSEDTAKRLVEKMRKCKGLLYISSRSSKASKWCPWEVGVFSGIKNFRCANLPLTEVSGEDFKGQEYLDLYPYAEYDQVEGKNVYQFWICESDTKYVTLKEWLNGKKPYQH